MRASLPVCLRVKNILTIIFPSIHAFQGYQSPELLLKKKSGAAIANKMKQQLEDVLREKIASIKVCFRCILSKWL